MKSSYPLNTFPQFLKFYNCLEFIPGEDYGDLCTSSNIQLYWGMDSKPGNLYFEVAVLLVFKYDKYKIYVELDGRRGGQVFLKSDISFDNYDNEVDNYYDIEFSYRIHRSIDIPEFKQLLRIGFDKNTKYKDITHNLLKNRCTELYNRLINEETLFNILKPHIEDIKNFEFMFLKQSDFINDNYFNIANTHDKVQSIINHQPNQQRNE